MSTITIGADLGTTNSVIAYVNEHGQAEVIASREGGRTIPSVVAFLENETKLVGKPAVDQESVNATNTFRSIKRTMGTKNKIISFGKEYSPEEISAEILKKIKSDAELFLGKKVDSAVITVPAYFNNDQRQATITAGEIAGLKVLRIINEPTAAALAYGLGQGKNETVLVYDLGGGTFDVTVLKISDDGVFEVLSTSGDTHLGGDDFDKKIEKRLIDKLASQIVNSTGHYLTDALPFEFEVFTGGFIAINDSNRNISLDDNAKARIREAAVQAKIQLTSSPVASVNLPYIIFDNFGNPIHLQHDNINKSDFEADIEPLINKTKTCVMQALNDAKVRKSDIDEVIFVGGSTRVPSVAEAVEKWIGKKPNRSVNPDEAVGIGAAIQASIINGTQKEDVVLLDIIPISLGVETQGGYMAKVVSRNTTIPLQTTEMFSTAEDGQSFVHVRVYQGERPRCKDNILLGDFKLEDIPPAPRGVPQIDVTFNVDANSVLSVQATDRATGIEKSLQISGASSLTKEQIQAIISDAESHKEQDKQFAELAEITNELDNTVIQIESLLRTPKGVFSEETLEDFESVRESLEDARTIENLETVRSILQSAVETIENAGRVLRERAESITIQE